MSNEIEMNDLQGAKLVRLKKDWKKPVLDILELEGAQAGIGSTGDHRLSHHSGGGH